MKKWSILLTIAVVALLMPMSSAMVNAQDETSFSFSISKSADKDSATVGETVTYTYIITNNSDNVTDNVTLVDSNLAMGTQGQISLSKTTLGPGDNVTATATYIVVEADLPGPLENTATASGTADGNTVTDNTSETVELTYLQLTKTADSASAAVGDNITYTYTITNNADNITISNISLVDDKLGPIPLNGSDNITLAPGAKVTAIATYTVLEKDLVEQGSIINTATVTGTDPGNNPLTASATATVQLTSPPPIEEPSIEVTKSADKTSATLGDNITYIYTITNTGNVALSNITLVDDKLPEVSLGSDNITLIPAATVIATGNHTVSIFDFFLRSTIVNTADVNSVDPNGKPVTDSATATVSISKTLFWKHDILKRSGVPGKGIDKAPGLQKPFNPKSQAAEHAGKKDKPKTPEQLQIREWEENQGTEEQLQIQSEVQNQAGNEQAIQDDDEDEQAAQDDDEDRDGKGQLKKFSGTDNQTQVQQATQGNGHKPDKDKPKKNLNSGNNH